MHGDQYYNNYFHQNQHYIPPPPIYHINGISRDDYHPVYHEDFRDAYHLNEINLSKNYKRRGSYSRRRRNSYSSPRHFYEESPENISVYDDDYYYPPENQSYRRFSGVRSVSPYRQRENDIIVSERRVTLDPSASWVRPANDVFANFIPQNPMTKSSKPGYYSGMPYQANGLGVGVTSNSHFLPMTTNALVPPPLNQLNNYNNELLFMPQPTVPMIPPLHLVPGNNNFIYPQPFPFYIKPFAAPANTGNAKNPNCATTDNGNIIEEAHKPESESQSPPSTQGESRTVISNNETTNMAPASDQSIRQPKVTIKRRKSLMEGILSSFSLLQEPERFPVTSDGISLVRDQHIAHNMDTSTFQEIGNHSQISNLSDTEKKSAVLAVNDSQISTDTAQNSFRDNALARGKSSSLRLNQKATLLKSREYIWCYRVKEEGIENHNNMESVHPLAKSDHNKAWSAFDVRNQAILDGHYTFMIARRINNPNDKPNEAKTNKDSFVPKISDHSSVFILNKQSNLPGPVMVSIQDGFAWCKKNFNLSLLDDSAPDESNKGDFIILELSYLPTRLNTLVFTEDSLNETDNILSSSKTNSSLRRSKSMDRVKSKLFKTILQW